MVSCGKPYGESAPCNDAERKDGVLVVPVRCAYKGGCQHKGKVWAKQTDLFGGDAFGK